MSTKRLALILITTLFIYAEHLSAQVNTFRINLTDLHPTTHKLNKAITAFGQQGNIQVGLDIVESFDNGSLEKSMAMSLYVRQLYGRDSSYQYIDNRYAPLSATALYIKSWLSSIVDDIDDYTHWTKLLKRSKGNASEYFLYLESVEHIQYMNRNAHNRDREKQVRLAQELKKFIPKSDSSEILKWELTLLQVVENNNKSLFTGIYIDSVIQVLDRLYGTYSNYMDSEQLIALLDRGRTPEAKALLARVKADQLQQNPPSFNHQMNELWERLTSDRITTSDFEQEANNLFDQNWSKDDKYKWKAAFYIMHKADKPIQSPGLIRFFNLNPVHKSFSSTFLTRINDPRPTLENKVLVGRTLTEIYEAKSLNLEEMNSLTDEESYLLLGYTFYMTLGVQRIKDYPLLRYKHLEVKSWSDTSWSANAFLLNNPLYYKDPMSALYYPDYYSKDQVYDALNAIDDAINKYPNCYYLHKNKYHLLYLASDSFYNDSLVYTEFLHSIIDLCLLNQSEGSYRGDYTKISTLFLMDKFDWSMKAPEIYQHMKTKIGGESVTMLLDKLKNLIDENPRQTNLQNLYDFMRR